jgi:hypothetical protein
MESTARSGSWYELKFLLVFICLFWFCVLCFVFCFVFCLVYFLLFTAFLTPEAPITYGVRSMKVVFAPHLPNASCYYLIDQCGIQGLEMRDEA